MEDLSVITVLGAMIVAGGGWFAYLAWRLGRYSAQRNDVPGGNPTVIQGYWAIAALLVVCGGLVLIAG
jgi:hypothetical protein